MSFQWVRRKNPTKSQAPAPAAVVLKRLASERAERRLSDCAFRNPELRLIAKDQLTAAILIELEDTCA